MSSEEEVQITGPTGYSECPICGDIVKDKGKYAHFRNNHPELDYNEHKQGFRPVLPPKEEAETPTEPPTPYKAELDATAILRQILEKHPDISPKVVNEVCSWAEYGPIHPTQLVYLLQSMRGIQSTTANIVAQKYSLALQKAQQEGRVQIPPPMYSPQLQQPQWGAPFPMPFQPSPSQPQPQMFPYQQPLAQAPSLVVQPPTPQPSPFAPQPSLYPPYWQPPQDVEKVVKGQIEDMKRYVDAKLETLRPREEQYVEIYEPLRTPEGKVIVDSEGNPIVRTVRAPVSQASQIALAGDPELRFLEKMKHYKDLFGKEELTLEKVRSIIKEEVPKKREVEGEVLGKPITREDVEKAVTEASTKAAHTVLAQVQREDEEERRHRELLDAIQRGSGAKVVEGYKQDAYRFLGQGMGEVARVIEKKEPIKIIIQGARDILATGPPPKEVEEDAREGVIGRLPPEWVAEE